MSVRPGTLDLRSVTVRTGAKTLVDNVSISVSEGEMVGLLGPNGAGKSSLLRTVYRINRPASGTVLVNGEDAWRQPLNGWRAMWVRCFRICRRSFP
ncbi:ATP-binding cassette domain-containing protein [Nitratireductor aquibiodomus]|uniref:ATP-binding cassette domain-containing protein n=1 Tax=Nitratireductor aquibiodomus TaxID=204799 RepID=UPI000AD52E34|nr:ATP-binding cassette domain-containing protein [Nitratireductor aquibiodomus]